MEWGENLSDDERDRLVEKIATEVVRRGLAVPAILFLEMHRPVAFLASQGLVVASPFLMPFVGAHNIQQATALLQCRDNVERVICRIEELNAETGAKGPEKAEKEPEHATR